MLTLKKYNFLLLIIIMFLSFIVVASIAAFGNDPLKNTRYYYDIRQTENIIGSDFNANYFAAKRYFSKDSLYFTDAQSIKYNDELLMSGNKSRFIYYPFSAFFFVPFTLLSFNNAFILLTLLNIILLLSVFLLLSRFALNAQLYFFVFSFLILFSPAIWSILERGQSDIIILFFLTLCFVRFTEKRQKSSGFFLALAGLFKLTPLFLLPFFYFKDKKVFFYSILFFLSISFLTGIGRLPDFFRSLFIFSSQYSSSYLNTGIFGLFYNKITSLWLNTNSAHLIYLIIIAPLVLLLIYNLKKNISKENNYLTSLSEFGFFLAIMLLLPTVSWIQHSIHLIFIATAYWIIRETATPSKKIVLMDVFLLLIFSEPLLLLKFQEFPLSIIFALRPLYISLFLVLFYFTFMRNKKYNVIAEAKNDHS